MNEDLLALGRRAVACSGWRWMPGMRTTGGSTVFAVEEDESDGLLLWVAGPDPGRDAACEVPAWDVVPDLSDPATLGCVLALVREAWGEPRISAVHSYRDGRRAVRIAGAHDIDAPLSVALRLSVVECATEFETLVAALELARVSRVRGAPGGGERGP